MKDNKRFVCKRITKDCVFPGALCELKDIKGKFSILLENIDDAKIICDMLNQQDILINYYKKDLKDLLSKFFDYMKALAGIEFNADITPNDFSLLRKYFILFRYVFKEEFLDFYRRICDKCDLNSNFINKKD